MVSSLHKLSLNPFRQQKNSVHHATITSNHYHDASLWRCDNKHSNRVHIIHGPLAKILHEYPEDYCLTYLGPEQASLPYHQQAM